VSTNGVPIRILMVGETRQDRRLRGLRELNSGEFSIAHVPSLEIAAESLTRESADIMLLDIAPKQSHGRVYVQAARAAAPDVPIIILAESEHDSLAIELLQLGVQDFLPKKCLNSDILERSLRFAIERHRLQKTIQSLSLVDDLTGLYNRRGFLALAEQHLRMVLRKGAALLVYLDLDDFKLINDTYGHLEGNRALIATANILHACFRQSDILSRLGGDEFCVLMTDACQDTAQQVIKRLQQRVDVANGPANGHFRLSLSVGIADIPAVDQPSLEELLKTADARMYEQKRIKRTLASASHSASHPTLI
jgi:two-component system cell cycle response regulator